jgi:hypothetical protein
MVLDQFLIAQHFLSTNKWKLYLSQDEGRVLNKMTVSREVFEQILRDPSGLLRFEDLSDIFEQQCRRSTLDQVIGRIRGMIWDHYVEQLMPIEVQQIEKLAHEIDQKEDGMNAHADAVNSLIPIEDLYFSLEHDAELIPKLHLFDVEEDEIKEDHHDADDTVQEIEEQFDAPNGLKAWYNNVVFVAARKENWSEC